MTFTSKILLLVLTCLFQNCQRNSEPLKYGIFYDDMESGFIDLDSIVNLDMMKLYNEIYRIRCDGKLAVLRFKGELGNKQLSVYNDCGELGCSRVNNVFFIIDEEILKNKTIYNLNELERQLTKDYLNEGKEEGYSTGPSYLFLRVKCTSKNPHKLIELLDRITSVHGELGMTEDLMVKIVSPDDNEDQYWRN